MRFFNIQTVLTTSILAAFFFLPRACAKDYENSSSAPKKVFEKLKENYMLDITINSAKVKKKFSLLVYEGSFEFSRYLPEAIVAFEGTVNHREKNSLLLKYKIVLKEKTVLGANGNKRKSVAWLEDGCESLVKLELNKEVTLFQTENRSYKLRMRLASKDK